jgi:hypothetical protein
LRAAVTQAREDARPPTDYILIVVNDHDSIQIEDRAGDDAGAYGEGAAFDLAEQDEDYVAVGGSITVHGDLGEKAVGVRGVIVHGNAFEALAGFDEDALGLSDGTDLVLGFSFLQTDHFKFGVGEIVVQPLRKILRRLDGIPEPFRHDAFRVSLDFRIERLV